jgi:hypothetical protein
MQAHPTELLEALERLDPKGEHCRKKTSSEWAVRASEELHRAFGRCELRCCHPCNGINGRRWIQRFAVMEAAGIRMAARVGLSHWRLGLMRGQHTRLPQISGCRYSLVEEVYLERESSLRRVFSSMYEAEQRLLELQTDVMEMEQGTAMRDLHEAQSRARASLVRDRAELKAIQGELEALQGQQTRADQQGLLPEAIKWADALVMGRAGYPLLTNGEKAREQITRATAGLSSFQGSLCLGKGVLCTQYRYKEAAHSDFWVGSSMDDNCKDFKNRVECAMLRRECRGLVVGPAGVVARPMQRFFSFGQLTDGQRSQLDGMTVAEVTEKLDGTMVFGIVAAGGTELWTKAGFTEQGRAATRFAQEGAGGTDYLGLLAAVEAQGCTASFEWLGKQSLVRVRVENTQLVLLQVRDKVTGNYWGWGQRVSLANQFGVPVVMPVADLEGCTLREVMTQVKQWVGREGVVVRLTDGCMLKIKSSWWLNEPSYIYRRWLNDEHRNTEISKWERRQANQQSLQHRALFTGRLGSDSPAVLLQKFAGAVKIEAFYDRDTGKRGAVIISFRQHSQQEAAVQAGDSLEPAYSVRSRGRGQKRVMTWNLND